jgi:hypothetical protein
MTKKADLENLARVKTALADKYERLAQTRKSETGKKTLLHHAKRHRQQAAVAQSKSKANTK